MSGSDPIYGRPYAIAGKDDGVRTTLNARDLGENREWEKLAGWAASVAAQLALLPSAGKAPRKDAERGVAHPRGSVPPTHGGPDALRLESYLKPVFAISEMHRWSPTPRA